ncbi:MAG: DUF47 family protein, partial [Cellulomonadaceae bacterium]|nr:DUF47 family protein [Cellulomonadaceae bacterium]
MRLSLSPKDSAFYDLFSNLARHTVTGASILTEMLGVDVPARVDLAKVFTDVEHAADDDADAIMKRVNQTFVTPFDRDDIYDLTSALDDAVDAMEEAADLIVLYKLDVLPTKVGDMVQVLQRCAEL